MSLLCLHMISYDLDMNLGKRNVNSGHAGKAWGTTAHQTAQVNCVWSSC